MQKLYSFSRNFIQILSLVFVGILFLSSFLFTCYADDMVSQQVLTSVDNPILQLLGIGIFALLVFLCCGFVCAKKSRNRILLILVFGWIFFLGGVLILFGKTVPAADAWSVYDAANKLAAGNTNVIHPTDSYLSYYPQQVGLMAFFELLIRLWKLLPTDLHAYHFIKCLYVVLTLAIVYYQYLSVRLLWEDDRAGCIYLLLAGANLPLIMYSSFVYGEIPSFAALSAGIFYLLTFLKSGKSGKLTFVRSLIFLTIAVMLRKNSLILIIAIVLVVLLEGMKTKRKELFLFALLCTICSLSILPLTQKLYELRAHNHLKSGVPAMSYFAMGMQESSRGNGWYNGFNFNTYQATGMDTTATIAISRRYIAERTAYFKAHPSYAANFYWNKFLSQWADGTYASRQATLATFGGRKPFVEAVYTGEFSHLYIRYCNLYQSLIYLGCFFALYLALRRKEKPQLCTFLCLIGAFGGFLFHMIWEANARYVFLYSLLLLPYAARGIADFSNTSALGRFRKNNTGRRPDATEKPSIEE